MKCWSKFNITSAFTLNVSYFSTKWLISQCPSRVWSKMVWSSSYSRTHKHLHAALIRFRLLFCTPQAVDRGKGTTVHGFGGIFALTSYLVFRARSFPWPRCCRIRDSENGSLPSLQSKEGAVARQGMKRDVSAELSRSAVRWKSAAPHNVSSSAISEIKEIMEFMGNFCLEEYLRSWRPLSRFILLSLIRFWWYIT